ncbi:MAG: tRNA glutamyl-Q(34) synthetase GluQRS [Methylophilaceae bacterium]
MHYVGRFAPSPTGPLHFGSLVAAVASYLEAKVNQGQWLVRMEDLDKPREVAGAANNILHTLEAFGFEWDNSLMVQSQRDDAYAAALSRLKEKQLIYPCTCSRKEITDTSTQIGIEGAIYPQTCLKQSIKGDSPIAWRIKTENKQISFHDAIQGNISQNLIQDTGDFILRRADGLFAYQLAVVVDDAEQGVTHVVRGSDLLHSTPRQMYLQSLLGDETPSYAHVPVATNADGQKLSKQTMALGLKPKESVAQLWEALCFLNQNPPETLKNDNLSECWHWAMSNWNVTNIPNVKGIQV